jgi:predicted nucleic acid-binding protein
VNKSVILDTGPLGLLAHTKVTEDVVHCTAWLRTLVSTGVEVIVPEIADYEVRRELLRLGATKGLFRLESLLTIPGTIYQPIDTGTMRLAAELWASARKQGRPTADAKALDADVILAAQVLRLAPSRKEVIVATTNIRHISRFVTAAHWRDISGGTLRSL